MEYILIGLVSAFNMLIIKFKVDRKRYEDAFFDTILMVILALLFAGTFAGMVVAMVASLVISIFLFISPPTFSGKIKSFFQEQVDDFNKQFDTNKNKQPKTTETFNL